MAVARSPELAGQFDKVAVPELQSMAESRNPVNLRMRAVFALRRAGTPGARAALDGISHSTDDSIAQAARNGLH